MHLGENKQNATISLPIITITIQNIKVHVKYHPHTGKWKSIVFNNGMPRFILFKIVTLFYM